MDKENKHHLDKADDNTIKDHETLKHLIEVIKWDKNMEKDFGKMRAEAKAVDKNALTTG